MQPEWEYMFVKVWKGKIKAIGNLVYEDERLRPIWEDWLREQGLRGWQLVSEYSFQEYSIHATLKRQL